MRRPFASIVLLLISAPADAERFQYGGRSEAFWTDNAFGTNQNASDVGWAARVGPWADLEDHEGRATWGLHYAPDYEYYLDQSSLRGFDHDASGRFAWQVGDRTTFSASEQFQRSHSVTSFNEQAAPGEDLVAVGQRQLISVNNVTGTLDHQLGPVDRVSFSAAQSLYDYSDEDQLDHTFLGATFSYDHGLSARTSVGTRLSWGRQTTDRLEVSDDVTDYYNFSGVISYVISPTSQLSLSAGPALITSNSVDLPTDATVGQFPIRVESDGTRHFLNASSCPEDPPGVHVVGPECEPSVVAPSGFNPQVSLPIAGALPVIDNSNTTYFANLTLSKRWEHWRGALGYTRSAGQSTAVASVSDVVYGGLNWDITQRWTADLNGSFQRREQANQGFVLSPEVQNVGIIIDGTSYQPVAESTSIRAVEVDSGTGVDVLSATLRVAYQLAMRASLYANVSWREQTFTGDASALGGGNRLALTVGLNYSFEPVNF